MDDAELDELETVWGTDFRFEAITESRDAVDKCPGLSPLQLESSFCLPVRDEYESIRKHELVHFFLAMMGMIGAPAIGLWADPEGGWVLLALWVSVGILCTLITRRKNAELMTHLVERDGSMCVGREDAVFVSLEDANTFDQQKLSPEDLAACVLDSKGKRMLIEGLMCRYIIRAEDIRQIQAVKSSNTIGTAIHFKAGDAHMGIVLTLHGIGIIRLMINSFYPMYTNRFIRRMNKALFEAPSSTTRLESSTDARPT